MDKRILKFVAQNLSVNTGRCDYTQYRLCDFVMSANEEMLDWLFELGYLKPVNPNGYKFTQKALDILNEE